MIIVKSLIIMARMSWSWKKITMIMKSLIVMIILTTGHPCLFCLPSKKSKVGVCSMELLIAHAAIKVASKGFFRVPQKWRQKLPTTEIKRLERRLVGALAPLIFAQRPLFHISCLLSLSMLPTWHSHHHFLGLLSHLKCSWKTRNIFRILSSFQN